MTTIYEVQRDTMDVEHPYTVYGYFSTRAKAKMAIDVAVKQERLNSKAKGRKEYHDYRDFSIVEITLDNLRINHHY